MSGRRDIRTEGSTMSRVIVFGRRLIVAVAVIALVSPDVPTAVRAEVPASGIVCMDGTGPTGSNFELTAKSGFVGLPDGNSVFMWSYAPRGPLGDYSFQLPGPTLCVTQGQIVTVTLHNDLPEAVSIVFPGQTGVRVGTNLTGPLVQPQLAGGQIVSLAQAAAGRVGSVVSSISYTFLASHAGTYLYQSGTDEAKQLQMGLYGALVVRPAGFPGRAYAAASTAFNRATEYVLLMSEVDPALHQAVEQGQPYRPAAYHPRYWMLNGRSFPDTIAPNGASWLPTQPYSSFIHMQPYSDPGNPLPALVRYLSVGTRSHPFHPHGNHGRIIARDGRPVSGPATDLTYEKFLVNVGPGQTWDVTYTWENVEHWNPDTNPIPVTLPQQQDTIYKDDATWYGGSPYLGSMDDLPVGVTTFNECGEYYQMWHSHALNEAANYEAGFGGMMTIQRIDPPSPNDCP
jgi:hypothetical protein